MPDTIKIGERYRRPVGTMRIYQVVRLVSFPHHPPHAVLVCEAADRRSMTVGISVLKDRRHWVKADQWLPTNPSLNT